MSTSYSTMGACRARRPMRSTDMHSGWHMPSHTPRILPSISLSWWAHSHVHDRLCDDVKAIVSHTSFPSVLRSNHHTLHGFVVLAVQSSHHIAGLDLLRRELGHRIWGSPSMLSEKCTNEYDTRHAYTHEGAGDAMVRYTYTRLQCA